MAGFMVSININGFNTAANISINTDETAAGVGQDINPGANGFSPLGQFSTVKAAGPQQFSPFPVANLSNKNSTGNITAFAQDNAQHDEQGTIININIMRNAPQKAGVNQAAGGQAGNKAGGVQEAGKHKHGQCNNGGDKAGGANNAGGANGAGGNGGGDPTAGAATGSQSAVSQAIQDITGHRKGQLAQGSRLGEANEILDAIMQDPRWQQAEAVKRAEQVGKNGKKANQWDILANTAFHSIFNAETLGGNAMSGDISAIQDDAEKVLMKILKDIGGNDPQVEKLLLAALHFKTTGVDLSNKVSNEPSQATPSEDPPDPATLENKPARSALTKGKSMQSMDGLGFAKLVGWNHDFSDGKVDGKMGRKTLDKEVIFNGADPLGTTNETAKALQAMDPSLDESGAIEGAYDLSYHDIVGNLLSGGKEKIDVQKLEAQRLKQLGQRFGKEKQMDGFIQKMGQHIQQLMSANPEFASGLAGASAAALANVMTGCPYASVMAGIGTRMGAMQAINKIQANAA
jgi:ABC-type Fe3+-hydroxamate transport system substrate-binding protein